MKGFKTVKTQVMDFVEANGPTRRTDILRFVHTVIYKEAFDPIRMRGSCARAFLNVGKPHLRWPNEVGTWVKPSRREPRYLVKAEDGVRYKVRGTLG